MSDQTLDLNSLALSIKDWGRELGFQQVGITDVELGEHEAHLQRWLDAVSYTHLTLPTILRV